LAAHLCGRPSGASLNDPLRFKDDNKESGRPRFITKSSTNLMLTLSLSPMRWTMPGSSLGPIQDFRVKPAGEFEQPGSGGRRDLGERMAPKITVDNAAFFHQDLCCKQSALPVFKVDKRKAAGVVFHR